MVPVSSEPGLSPSATVVPCPCILAWPSPVLTGKTTASGGFTHLDPLPIQHMLPGAQNPFSLSSPLT